MLSAAGKSVDSQNKRQVMIQDEKGGQAFVNIIIATIQELTRAYQCFVC